MVEERENEENDNVHAILSKAEIEYSEGSLRSGKR